MLVITEINYHIWNNHKPLYHLFSFLFIFVSSVLSYEFFTFGMRTVKGRIHRLVVFAFKCHVCISFQGRLVFVISFELQSINISRSVYKGSDCVTSVFVALSPCDHKKCPNQLYLSMMHSSLLAEPSKTWYKLLSAPNKETKNQQKVWICLPCTPRRPRSSDLSKVSSFLLTRISTNQGILTDIQS